VKTAAAFKDDDLISSRTTGKAGWIITAGALAEDFLMCANARFELSGG
jgi:hypothetical protein